MRILNKNIPFKFFKQLVIDLLYKNLILKFKFLIGFTKHYLNLIDTTGSKGNECRCSNNSNNRLKNTLLQICQQLDRGNESTSEFNSDSWSANKLTNGTSNNSNNSGNDFETVPLCSKKNCNSSIQLQAMIAQLLGIQGLIACAITRILLKKIPGSQVNESTDEIMERTGRLLSICLKHDSKILYKCNMFSRIYNILSIIISIIV